MPTVGIGAYMFANRFTVYSPLVVYGGTDIMEPVKSYYGKHMNLAFYLAWGQYKIMFILPVMKDLLCWEAGNSLVTLQRFQYIGVIFFSSNIDLEQKCALVTGHDTNTKKYGLTQTSIEPWAADTMALISCYQWSLLLPFQDVLLHYWISMRCVTTKVSWAMDMIVT